MEGAYPALQMRTNGVVFERGHPWAPWVPAEANMREIEGLTVYAFLLHAHTLGRKVWTEHFRPDSGGADHGAPAEAGARRRRRRR